MSSNMKLLVMSAVLGLPVLGLGILITEALIQTLQKRGRCTPDKIRTRCLRKV